MNIQSGSIAGLTRMPCETAIITREAFALCWQPNTSTTISCHQRRHILIVPTRNGITSKTEVFARLFILFEKSRVEAKINPISKAYATTLLNQGT
jgi:hypothetical protein